MRTLLFGVLLATVVGCSCPPLPRQVSMQGCTDADGLACLGTTGGKSIEEEFSLLENPTSAEFGDTKSARRKSRLRHGLGRFSLTSET